MARFVEFLTNSALEKSGEDRKKIGRLPSQLVKKNILLRSQFVKGLEAVLEIAEDLVVDIPKIWDYFGELIGSLQHIPKVWIL